MRPSDQQSADRSIGRRQPCRYAALAGFEGGALKLGQLFADAAGFDRAEFVNHHPEPALVFVRGFPDARAGDEGIASDQTTELKTTTKLRLIRDQQGEMVAKMRPDSVVIFLKKRSAWTPFSDVLTVGRATIQDVRIPLSSVSKFHVTLTRGAAGWRVTDQRAVNGTFVDGKRLDASRAAPLRDGTRLGFGPETEAFFFTPDGLFDLVASHRRF